MPWRPSEIIVNNSVREDPITQHFLAQCPNVPVSYVDGSLSSTVKMASTILRRTADEMLPQILAGKLVVHISPAGVDVVDDFQIEDPRMMCPEFDRVKFAANGCFYNCDWCFLKLTYRTVQNYISVHVEYDKIKRKIIKRLRHATSPVMFNSGEMADSLALEHLTKAGQEFIPFFGEQENGYLYMLTKSDNVDRILQLPHNQHTIIAWSLNDTFVSNLFEVGAPAPAARIRAAQRAQNVGYPIRVRLDPIVPIPNWKHFYGGTIRQIFENLTPERITLGTLRFEKRLFDLRNTIFNSPELRGIVGGMKPMLEAQEMADGKKSGGKYTFPDELRVEMFRYAVDQIRRHSPNIPIALCKESQAVWEAVGLEVEDCQCACVYGSANPTIREVAVAAKSVSVDFKEILGDDQIFVNRKLYQVPIKALVPDPDQPRKFIDEGALEELHASIEKHGVLQPILFRKTEDDKLVIVAGERRYRAAEKAKLKTIPACFIDGQNVAELALVENLLRENLNPIEEAEALERLQKEQSYKLKDLAAVIGKKESTISEILSLNKLPKKIKDKCRKDVRVSRRVLVEIAKAPNDEEMKKRFKKYEKENVSSDQLRAAARKTRTPDASLLTAIGGLNTQLQQIDLTILDTDKKQNVEAKLTELRDAINRTLG